MSKRIKINFQSINGDNWSKLDVGDFNARLEEQKKIEQENKKKEQQKEKDRINNIKCPCCKSINKHHYIKRDGNGIMGPGFSSWIIDEYLICLDCGIHFNDLKKSL